MSRVVRKSSYLYFCDSTDDIKEGGTQEVLYLQFVISPVHIRSNHHRSWTGGGHLGDRWSINQRLQCNSVEWWLFVFAAIRQYARRPRYNICPTKVSDRNPLFQRYVAIWWRVSLEEGILLRHNGVGYLKIWVRGVGCSWIIGPRNSFLLFYPSLGWTFLTFQVILLVSWTTVHASLNLFTSHQNHKCFTFGLPSSGDHSSQ